MVVASARLRAAGAAVSHLDVEGSGARKYLRRGRDYAGNVLSLMVGCRGTGRFTHEQLRDRQGQRFVVWRACRKSHQSPGQDYQILLHAELVARSGDAEYEGSSSHSSIRSQPGRELI